MKIKKYFIEKSNEPNDDGKFVLFLESKTEHGINYQKVFKGTRKKCVEEKRKKVEEK